MRRIYFLALALTSLSACKIAGTKRPVDPDDATGGNTVFSFMKSQQVAVSVPAIAVAMSGINATALVATNESTFGAWIDPAPNCKSISNDQVSISASRLLEIGDLKIGDLASQEIKIPFDVDSGSYSIGGTLAAGQYRIRTAGNSRGTFAYSQDFIVPRNATGIRFTSGTGTAQPIPSPDIPAEADSDYYVNVDRSKDLRIEYDAPADTTYVRTFLYDGSNQSTGAIVCYSPPNTPTTVPSQLMRYFRQTNDGYAFVDFVNISLRTDVPNIKEALIQSYKRHMHGMQEFYTEDGNLTIRFGVLKFQ